MATSGVPVAESEILRLWGEEVEKYNKIAKVDQLSSTKKTIEQQIEEYQGGFTSFRNKGTPGDKVRKVLKRMSGILESVVSMAGSFASAAFPPAQGIAQALGFVFKACNEMSAKFDQVVAFYDTVSIFLERLSLLRERLPPEAAFRTQLTRVFGTILRICGWAQSAIKLKRFIVFTKVLFQMDDGLADAYTEFNNQMAHLESSIITSTLGLSVQTSRDVTNMWEMTQQNYNMLYKIMLALPDFSQQNTVDSGRGSNGRDSNREHANRHSREISAGDNASTYQAKVMDSGQRKSVEIEGVLQRLLVDSQSSPRQRLGEMSRAYIQNTGVWLEKRTEYNNLKYGKGKRLVIHGRPSTGKSMALFYVFRNLLAEKAKPNEKILVAYFSFANWGNKPFSVRDMISCCALQFAQQDGNYRKNLIDTLKAQHEKAELAGKKNTGSQIANPTSQGENSNCCDTNDQKHRCWKLLFETPFQGNGKENTEKNGACNTRMFFMLDDYENLEKADQLKNILNVSAQTEFEAPLPEISFVLTATDKNDEWSKNSRFEWINMSFRSSEDNLKEGREEDLRIIAWAHLSSMRRLLILSVHERTAIIEEVCKRADSFWYIEHTLYGLNRSTPYEVERDKLPENTTSIHKSLVWVNQDSSIQKQRENILVWLAFANRRFTLGAIRRLLDLTDSGGVKIKIDDELEGPLSRILSLEPDFSEAMDHNRLSAVVGEYDDSSFIGFFESSFRQFFCEIKVSHQITMFLLLTDVLAKLGDSSQTSLVDLELFSYAAASWSDFLVSLTASREEAPEILKSIYKVLQVHENWNEALANIGSQPDMDKTKVTSISKAINTWAKFDLETNPLTPEEERFRRHVRGSPENALKQIAKAHAQNCRFARYPIDAYTCLESAYRTQENVRSGDIEYIIKIVKKDLWENDPGEAKDETRDYLSLAMALRYDHKYDEAEKYINKGLLSARKEDISGWRLFELYDRSGRINFGRAEFADFKGVKVTTPILEKAMESFEAAIEQVTAPVEGLLETIEKERFMRTKQLILRIKILLQIANSTKWGKDAIDTMSKQNSEILYFDDIVGDLAARDQWEKMHTFLTSVVDTQLADQCRKETHKAIHRFTQKYRSSLQTVKSLYEKSVDKLKKENNNRLLGPTLLWQARLLRLCSQRQVEAPDPKEPLLAILGPGSNMSLATKTLASWQLMDIYFADYLCPFKKDDGIPNYLGKKDNARNNMEHIVQSFIELRGADFELALSPLSIPLAIIDRDTNNTTKFFQRADETFQRCCDALTDGVLYNDAPSYLMLSKIFALLGLQSSAEIAFTKWCRENPPPDKEERDQAGENINNFQKRSKRRYKSQRRSGEPSALIKANVECSGICKKKMLKLPASNEPIRLCYYCTNTILCHDCWDWFQSNPIGAPCVQGHKYIKAYDQCGKDVKSPIERATLEGEWKTGWEGFMSLNSTSKYHMPRAEATNAKPRPQSQT